MVETWQTRNPKREIRNKPEIPKRKNPNGRAARTPCALTQIWLCLFALLNTKKGKRRLPDLAQKTPAHSREAAAFLAHGERYSANHGLKTPPLRGCVPVSSARGRGGDLVVCRIESTRLQRYRFKLTGLRAQPSLCFSVSVVKKTPPRKSKPPARTSNGETNTEDHP